MTKRMFGMIKGKFGRAFPIVISSEVEKSFFIEILRQAQNDKEDAQNDKERAGFFGKLRMTLHTVISSEVEKSASEFICYPFQTFS